MPNDHPRLFVIHIPKCGGMTLASIIEREYAPEAIYTLPSTPDQCGNLNALRNQWNPIAKQAIRIVKGHIWHGWHEAFGEDRFEYLVMLRHPVARALSLYNFIGEWHLDYAHKTHGLLAFAENATEIENQATYQLSGRIGRGLLAFNQAKTVIQSSVVGTVEQFDLSVRSFGLRYDWMLQDYTRLNVTGSAIRVISPEINSVLMERNRYDYILWQMASNSHRWEK